MRRLAPFRADSGPQARPGPALLNMKEKDVQILGLIAVGLVIGVLARLIVPGRQSLSILATLILGVVGALIGGTVASYFGRGNIWELNIVGFVVAVVAAVLLIGVAETMSGGRKRAL